ncbi:hypothetical protein [uncultured Paraglaciecola sp.]|uniref:hypothetical protein n=1 Tax=uncultured Paraglaciecola sp. TaxID=1765024 RepID=UPI002626F8A6|nr:hypothetical protein [uncultured Paraglaciecola sp.]
MKEFTKDDHKAMRQASHRLVRAENHLNELVNDDYPDLLERLVGRCENSAEHMIGHNLRTAIKNIESGLRAIEAAHSQLSNVQCTALSLTGDDTPIITASDR